MYFNLRHAIFISGKGSNLKALIDSYPDNYFYIYANKNCEGLQWARRRGHFTQVVSLKQQVDWARFATQLTNLKIEKLFLLGFMKVVPEHFLEKLNSSSNDFSCVNIHPSFLPHFPGLKAMEAAYKNQSSPQGSGCSLHEVTKEVDKGRIILQKKIESKNLSFSQFKERVHCFEQRLVSKFYELTSGNLGGGV